MLCTGNESDYDFFVSLILNSFQGGTGHGKKKKKRKLRTPARHGLTAVVFEDLYLEHMI